MSAVNYTPEMEAAIVAAAPLSFDSAKELAETLGKSHRSIIAKAKSLGVDYTPKAAPKKRVTGDRKKADVVADIAAATGVDVATLDGLDKATAVALTNLLTAVSS